MEAAVVATEEVVEAPLATVVVVAGSGVVVGGLVDPGPLDVVVAPLVAPVVLAVLLAEVVSAAAAGVVVPVVEVRTVLVETVVVGPAVVSPPETRVVVSTTGVTTPPPLQHVEVDEAKVVAVVGAAEVVLGGAGVVVVGLPLSPLPAWACRSLRAICSLRSSSSLSMARRLSHRVLCLAVISSRTSKRTACLTRSVGHLHHLLADPPEEGDYLGVAAERGPSCGRAGGDGAG